MDKLERAAEVGHIAKRNLIEVLERSLDAYLSKHDPAMRQARREKRGAGRARREKPAAQQPIAATGTRRSGGSTRSIPASLRDLLFIRANHRCEFLGSEGHRCSERSYLTIDHIVPWALGGPSEAGNLRVLCAAHNRFAADTCFSTGFMKHKIEAARCKAGGGGPRPDEFGMPDEVREPAPVYGIGTATVFAVSAIRHDRSALQRSAPRRSVVWPTDIRSSLPTQIPDAPFFRHRTRGKTCIVAQFIAHRPWRADLCAWADW